MGLGCWPRLSPNQIARDDHPHDLIRAFKDLMDPQIAHDLLNAIIGKVSVAAMELQALVRNAAAGFRSQLFGHGAEFGGIRGAGVELPGRVSEERSRGLEIDLHIREPELQRLELVD